MGRCPRRQPPRNLGNQAGAAAALIGKTAAPQLSCLQALSGFIHAIGGRLAYCSNCGQQGTEDASYCYNCGWSLDVPAGVSPLDGTDAGPVPDTVPWRTRQVVLGIAVVGVLSVPAAAIAISVGKLAGQYEEAMSTWLGVHLLGLVVIGAVWYLGIRTFNAPWGVLGLRPALVPNSKAVLLAVVTLAASLAASVVYVMIVDLIDVDILSPPEISSDIVFPGPAAVFTFQALAVVTPVVEEVFFRGFVFAGLAPRLGVVQAMVVSSVVFSVFHLGVGVFIPIFVTGLLLAWLYHRTGSLWPGVLAHGGQNALALAVGVYGV